MNIQSYYVQEQLHNISGCKMRNVHAGTFVQPVVASRDSVAVLCEF